VKAATARNGSELHFYGSNIRAIASAGAAFPQPGTDNGAAPADSTYAKGLVAIIADTNSAVHVHGTGIDVIGESTGSYDIGAVVMMSGSHFHAQASAYNLITPNGHNMHRLINIDGTANISAPYQWKQEIEPPSDLVSINGADMTVETDCGSENCTTTGTETHLLIYNDSCNIAGPWFDVVTGKCRGQL